MIRIMKYGEVSNEEIFARSMPTVNVTDAVAEIIRNVRERGDAAVKEYTEKFDKAKLDSLLVTAEEMEEALEKTGPEFMAILEKAAANIRKFHSRQVRNSFIINDEPGVVMGQKVIPVDRASVYVPGGKAAYPSSVLMNIVPARVAGVGEIIMTTPAGKTGVIAPAVLVAAKEAGADRIFKVGGAQAIAALAYGTETIPRVDKITGPGNIFVALAKKSVVGAVGIDSVAGPSEILVLADESANARYVAADLLSQAEHDELASAVLVTTSRDLADAVQKEIAEFLKKLERRDIIEKSLDRFGMILLADSMDDAIEAVNDVASEHLEIVTKNPFEIMAKVRNAGAMFLGPYSSEPLGDYFAGPNHILPTNGTARFFSPLSVDDFVKKSSVIHYSREALGAVHTLIEEFAKSEGLTAHANSIAVRFEEESGECAE